ncbi:MAG: TIM-barrel domain-containing protein [Methylomonas sp.]|jgi:alpha-glucosidase
MQPFDSSLSNYRYVPVDGFTPNSGKGWTSFGNVSNCVYDAAQNSFTITGVSGKGVGAPQLKIFILGPSAFRVWFNRSGNYSRYLNSYAVVNWNLGKPNVQVLQNDANKLSVELGALRLDVLKTPFTVQVYRNNVLISSDTAQGLEYIAGNDPEKAAIANFKSIPAHAHYFGFGEKGGDQLDMIGTSMTFFNFDNYKYEAGYPIVPTPGGPLNYAEPLYNSIPLLIEDNPNPLEGAPYSYGLFFDNESQSYFNIGQSSNYAGDMFGKYYFGALYGDLDYYFMAGDNTPQVIDQYTNLTGRPALPPMYALGYHQGCYGYYNQNLVLNAVKNYRNAEIPLDGMHIDVDFQNNYRTFTASDLKFPGKGAQVFSQLLLLGVKASTNITGIVSMVAVDENNQTTPYSALDEGLKNGYFYTNVRVDDPNPPASPQPLVVNESYGCNMNGFNPYPSPGAPYSPDCNGTPLGTYGHYADLGRPEVRKWWGTLYQPLLNAGLSMVWQDMTDPATQQSSDDSMPYKTLPLNLSVYDATTDAMVPHAQVHNVFALNLISATYEGLQQWMPKNERPFIIARGGYAGVQRYAATWTGDSASTWDFMSILIPEVLNFGLSGQPMAGADVGGFATGPGAIEGNRPSGIADPELLTRWTTLSAFFGWFRNHYDGYNKQYQEPYAYPNPGVAEACKKYIEIRYKLLQYFYDLSYESSQSGLPICRPLFLTDRADPNCYSQHNLTTQFMVGQNILVAPVVTQGSQNRDVYLPAGSQWFAYQDNHAPLIGPNPGGSIIDWYVPWNVTPIYVRAGAVIPRRELEQYVGESIGNGGFCPLTFDIYPGPSSTHLLYLDDKSSTDATLKQVYRTTQITQSANAGVQNVRVQRIYDNFKPAEPYYFVALLQATLPKSVAMDGAAIPYINSGDDNDSAHALATSAGSAYYYNQSLQSVFIKVLDGKADTTISATY